MSTVIIDSLNKLNQSLERLEAAAVVQKEQLDLKRQQQDLFAAQAASKPSNNGVQQNGNGGQQLSLDPSLVASKLDSMIHKVETILKEA